MKTGIRGYAKTVVSDENSAKNMGSGALAVFATPAMIALMEKAAWTSIQPYLEDGQGSVGISMNITHDAPTPLGMIVECETELIAIEGRKFRFSVTAFDEVGSIGRGIHERFIIDNDKFQGKADKKNSMAN